VCSSDLDTELLPYLGDPPFPDVVPKLSVGGAHGH
jgi:hypothetical protein